MQIESKSFPYQTDVVSEKQFDEHLELYKGYVTQINNITGTLQTQFADRQNANSSYSVYRGLKKGVTFCLNGVILHELYFHNIAKANSKPSPQFTPFFNNAFGSYSNWKDDFIDSAKAARGWCIFGYDQRSKSCRNILMDSHDEGYVALFYPLVVLDMYEHAYFMDYGRDKLSYIQKFMKSVNWDVANERLEKLIK